MAELFRAGIKPGNILLTGASATHRTTTKEDIMKKISAEAISKVRVIEHHVLDKDTLTYVGNTTRGTPAYLNAEVVSCDLIVGLGGIAPHGGAGFGGGAKLLLPGIAGYDTIKYNHTQIDQTLDFGSESIRPMRLDMEEAARMVNYRFNVSGLIDHCGNLVDIVAGDPIEAHRAGVEKAKKLYYVPVGKPADVVVACSNPLDVDCFQAVKGLFPSVRFVREGGTILWISSCPEGVGTHVLTQSDDVYCAKMVRSMANICKFCNVIFYSSNLKAAEIERYIEKEVRFYNTLQPALDCLVELAPPNADVKILYASPFTVGVQA